ncbi:MULTISPECIES: GAF domain-containing sensor histidine kinase [unclassified Nocardioides]|uniref:sensor histidine kinase n=1 Tax=unclassified Nocardioides TaxID=2615069 RepID=UPI0006F1E833|nr:MULTISPECIES: GAF domain-containing sensor histidine kinase [unclassified Nocardioides]KQY64445.1 diguanylate cyclase [Nocardioides sp. Root140]KQZ70369.1 diguanylate cyclase [Nocardioides sp. Root151]
MNIRPPDPGRPNDEPARSQLARTSFDDLLREVVDRTHRALDEQSRWKLLLDAVVTMGADLDLDALLSRIVEVASDLARAHYAALGVLDTGPERRLRTFITHGLTPGQKAKIGDLPTGHGILGLIIDRPEPLRLHDLAEHPESYGFPADHPPMKSFLGVPVRTREKVFGNLYLTEKEGGGDFTEEDEGIVVALAAAAGVAIENARLSEEAARRERWLGATVDIASSLSDAGSDALQTVADRAREVADADIAWVVVADAAETLALRVVSGVSHDAHAAEGVSFEHSLASAVLRSGTPIAVEDFVADERALDLGAALGWPRLGPVVIVPMSNSHGVSGALALGWVPANAQRFHELDTSLPASFAEQAALAIEITRAREDQHRLTLFEDRDRIARDLHDLVIQRLFAVGLGLQSLSRLADRPEIATRLATAVDDLDATIKDIRRTIFALGSMDDSADVQAEVQRIVDRSAETLGFRPSLQFEGPVRTRIGPTVVPDLLAVLGEALSNAARHAEASAVDVQLTAGDEIRLRVSDDGRGLPAGATESGLLNMKQRAVRLGGTCAITSRAGEGTCVEWSVPSG